MAPSIVSLEPEAPSVQSKTVDEIKSHATNGNKSTPSYGLDQSYTLIEKPLGTRRHLRVVCLGAGYSGLMMGILHNERMKHANMDFVIYERNEDLGGTWLENR